MKNIKNQILFLLLCLLSHSAWALQEVQAEIGKEPHIEVYLIQRQLLLKHGNEVIKQYPIGVARSRDFMTPPGSYMVLVKDTNPGWSNPYNPKIKIPPGPNNPLGTRWIGFHKIGKQAFGIHGTNDPSSVGKFVSHGCIRMKIPDAEDLFERIAIGTPVQVIYNRIEIKNIDGDIAITINEDPYQVLPLNLEELKKSILSSFPQAVINETSLQNMIQAPPYGQTRLVGYLPK